MLHDIYELLERHIFLSMSQYEETNKVGSYGNTVTVQYVLIYSL
jgi:hypothetical protein